MKDNKPARMWHTPSAKKFVADFHGTGIRQPQGKSLVNMGMPTISKKSTKKAPKGLA